jgi:hypothetical protein
MSSKERWAAHELAAQLRLQTRSEGQVIVSAP